MSVFKAYDIRGVYGAGLDEQLAYKIGRALVVQTGAKSVLLGRDARKSGPLLCKSFIKGLVDQGADVTFTGLCTTPMLHTLGHDFDASVNITASHNPKEYNGFKLYGKKGVPINADSGIKEIERLVEKDDWPEAEKGSLVEKDLREKYFEYVVEHSKGDYGLKVVVDASNGVAAVAVKPIFDRLNLDYRIINEEPDGDFPAHDPNPLNKKSHEQLSALIKDKGADLGVVFDGDGDRAVFLDEKGDEADLESIKVMIAESLLEQYPGASFVFDLISSRAIKDIIEPQGGKVYYERVGYSYIYHRMLKEDAVYGGEVSAHSFFKDIDYSDSAVYCALKLMRIIKQKAKPLSSLCEKYKRYERSGELNYEVKDKEEVLDAIERKYSDARISHLDGVSVELDDVWFVVRPSNTEPLLRLRIEGKSSQAVRKVKEEIEALIA